MLLQNPGMGAQLQGPITWFILGQAPNPTLGIGSMLLVFCMKPS